MGSVQDMAGRKASDIFVECLEAEGVKHVFGIPGEETLDLNESLAKSSVAFIPVRHEQGGAYMADMYGRLTGRRSLRCRARPTSSGCTRSPTSTSTWSTSCARSRSGTRASTRPT